MVSTNPLHHSKHKWEGWRWHENPLSRVSSEEGVHSGHESPLSLETQVGGECGWHENLPDRVSSEGGVRGGESSPKREWEGLVFGSPVRSGLLTPRAMDRNRNRSFLSRILKKTGPNRCGPVHIGFLRLHDRL